MSHALRTPDTRRLPIEDYLSDIARAVDTHAVVIVCGATGSGKSTRVPRLLLDADPALRIGHTQPRRLAARTVAARIALECGESLGERIGFQTRFDQVQSAATRLKVMTDGILLQEIARDRGLQRYDVLIIDEVHERSLNIDFLLGYLRGLLSKRPSLRVILMSATVEAERFRAFFNDAAIVEIPGATHPVSMRYRPATRDEQGNTDLLEQLVLAIQELDAEDYGDILVFLPGEREIHEAGESLRGLRLANTEILPLYARLTATDQQKVFTPHTARHIVLATNVAETSVTVPGVRHVIDSGLARIGSYSPRSKLQRLPITGVSQASAAQRAGRCGRERPGICVRLYSEEQLARRPLYTQPELQRSNLAGVILRLLDLKLGAVENFPLLDPPSTAAINDGYQLLRELGAIDGERQLLPMGKRLARLPIDPRLAAMVLAAADLACLREVLVIVSALSAGDVRERPPQARHAADLAHAKYRDARSDFLWYVNAWEALAREFVPLSRRQQQAYCVTQHWSWRRTREWLDIHRELQRHVARMNATVNAIPASYRAIHCALLHGLLTHVARWERKTEYVGCRQRRLRLHPSSSLKAHPPPWIMASEITETNATFARTAAKIDPRWIASIGDKILKRSHSAPQWDVQHGEAYVLEEQALFGLVITAGRRRALATFDLVHAREIFIRQALVQGELGASSGFLAHNLALMAKIRAAEERARRRDLLAEESTLCAFYTNRIPYEIATRRQLNAWLREAGERDALLRMDEKIATRAGIEGVTEYLYPDRLRVRGFELPLSYRYAPGEEDDGVTVNVPIAALVSITASDFDRLVPGLLAEKIAALIRKLPKAQRRYLSPVGEFAPALTAALESSTDTLPQALSEAAARMTGVTIAPELWQQTALPDYLKMRVRLIDAEAKPVAATRDLVTWLHGQTNVGARAFAALPWPPFTGGTPPWGFGAMPPQVSLMVGGTTLIGYPALRDRQHAVDVQVFAEPTAARDSHRVGLVRLLMLTSPRLVKTLRREVAREVGLELLSVRMGRGAGITGELVTAAFHCLMRDIALPREAGEFELLRDEAEQRAYRELRRLADEVLGWLEEAVQLRTTADRIAARWPAARTDIDAQLAELFAPGFLWERASELSHYARYLKGISVRLQRFDENPGRDAELTAAFNSVKAHCVTALARANTSIKARVRFLLNEYRVAVFAPQLRTVEKVSLQRIQEVLDLSARQDTELP